MADPNRSDQDRTFESDPAPTGRGRGQGLDRGEADAPGDPPAGSPAMDGLSANAQEDWGEPADEGATYSANHTTRGGKPDRSAGPKTRQATKDQISRR